MECRRCGNCCSSYQAYVRTEEIQRITSYLKITADDWEKLYDEPRWNYNNYRLIRHVNGACAFLKYENGLATCIIHAVKPACCAEWQPGPEKKECSRGNPSAAHSST